MSIQEMTHGMSQEEREEAQRMLDLQGHVELGVAELYADADDDAEEAQRMMDLQGFVPGLDGTTVLYSGDVIDAMVRKDLEAVQLPEGARIVILPDLHVPGALASAIRAVRPLTDEVASELDENSQEAQRMLDLQGFVAFPNGGSEVFDEQSPEYEAWRSWQGYVEQRLQYCP